MLATHYQLNVVMLACSIASKVARIVDSSPDPHDVKIIAASFYSDNRCVMWAGNEITRKVLSGLVIMSKVTVHTKYCLGKLIVVLQH